MRRIIKTASLVLPIAALGLFVAYITYQKWAIDQQMPDAHGVVWTDEGASYTVEIRKEDSISETRSYEIKVVDTAGSSVYRKQASFDFDMFGGGFVRAMQVDDDPDLEIVAWGAHEHGKGFFLDFYDGIVMERSFAEVPDNISQLAIQWHDSSIKRPVETVLYGFLLIAYYGLYLIIWLGLRLIRRKKPADPLTNA